MQLMPIPLTGLIALGLTITCTTLNAQQVDHSTETVDLSSPEGWAMAFMSAATLNLAQAMPRPTLPGRIQIATEIGSIPHLNEQQQRVGFGGFKAEDLNKSPVFGRLRVSLGLPLNSTAELSWTPPLEIGGARPNALWGAALSRSLLNLGLVHLGARLFAVRGTVTGDVTCSEEIARQTPGTVANPFSCIAPSEDELDVDHFGGELLLALGPQDGLWQPWASVAVTRMDPFTQVNAQLLNSLDRSSIDMSGTTRTYSIGSGFRVSDRWRLSAAASFTPLEVTRPPANPGGQDNFWSVRLGLSWQL